MKSKLILIIVLNVFVTSKILTQTSWFNRELSNCIIALEKLEGNSYVPHGTGFLVYNYQNPNEDWVITCGHVLKNSIISIKIPTTPEFRAYLMKVAPKTPFDNGPKWVLDGNNIRLDYKLIPGTTFKVDEKLDIGVFKVSIPDIILYQGDTINVSDRKTIPRSLIKQKNGVQIGSEVYFLGFPFSIGTNSGYARSGFFSDDVSNPLLRTGVVAWKSESSNEFLLDALSYNGNSGSPIFTKSTVFDSRTYLIGMVFGHLTHPAYGKEDINVGLARCIWIDDILKLLK